MATPTHAMEPVQTLADFLPSPVATEVPIDPNVGKLVDVVIEKWNYDCGDSHAIRFGGNIDGMKQQPYVYGFVEPDSEEYLFIAPLAEQNRVGFKLKAEVIKCKTHKDKPSWKSIALPLKQQHPELLSLFKAVPEQLFAAVEQGKEAQTRNRIAAEKAAFEAPPATAKPDISDVEVVEAKQMPRQSKRLKQVSESPLDRLHPSQRKDPKRASAMFACDEHAVAAWGWYAKVSEVVDISQTRFFGDAIWEGMEIAARKYGVDI